MSDGLAIERFFAQGTFLARLRDAIGANPIVLVVTKADFLPKARPAVASLAALNAARWVGPPARSAPIP